MPPKKVHPQQSQGPLSLEQLVEFYQKVIKPESREQLVEFYQKVIKPESLAQLMEFYQTIIKPETNQIMQDGLREFRDEVSRNFDFLFKKFETLSQEYEVIKHQLKRFDRWGDTTEELKKEIPELKAKVSDLYHRVEELEKNLPA